MSAESCITGSWMTHNYISIYKLSLGRWRNNEMTAVVIPCGTDQCSGQIENRTPIT